MTHMNKGPSPEQDKIEQQRAIIEKMIEKVRQMQEQQRSTPFGR